MKKFISILLLSAVIFCFSGCNGESENSAPVSDPVSSSVSETSGNTEPTSNTSSSIPGEPQKPTEEPTFLKGPDGDPIYPSEIDIVEINDNGTRREADISELTEDNLAWVNCENFGYLRESTGINYNHYESPEKFETEFPYFYKGEEIFNQNPIKRVNVGDKICGMTLIYTSTSFQEGLGDNSIPFWSDIPLFKFKGEVTLTGYLSVDTMTPDYPGKEGNVTFWLDEQSAPLPAVYLTFANGILESPFCTGIGFYNENYDIYLGSIYDNGTRGDYLIDEAMLDGITYGDTDVHVKITIDDYMTFGGADNRAMLRSLERL